jgi:hypothetical protein
MYTGDRGPDTGFPYRDPGADPPPHFALDDARDAPPSRWTVALLADRPRLDDRCRDEATFLLKFPQCDDDCRGLAMPYLGAGAPR